MTTTQIPIEHSSTSSSAKLFGVVADDLGFIWDSVEEYIVDGLRYSDGKYTLDDIKEELEDHTMQLFIVLKDKIMAAFVTQVIDYSQKRVLTVQLLGGKKMKEWLHLLPNLERWAIDEGCDQIEMCGRPGWEKVLKWEKSYVALKKDLNEVKH